jgi:hypothetical protein
MSLSMNQQLAMRDVNGNCKCPYCGKYRKESDFPDQPAHVSFGDAKIRGHISVPPACKFCIKEKND